MKNRKTRFTGIIAMVVMGNSNAYAGGGTGSIAEIYGDSGV